MLVAVRSPPDAPAGKSVDAINCSLSYIDPSSLYRYHHTASFSPANWNWGHFTNPKIDELLAKAQETFVPAERDKILASAHELIVDEAPWVWIVHDLNPRAMFGQGQRLSPGPELVPGFHYRLNRLSAGAPAADGHPAPVAPIGTPTRRQKTTPTAAISGLCKAGASRVTPAGKPFR